FFASSRRHTRCYRDWSSDVCSSDLVGDRFPALFATKVGVHGIALDRPGPDDGNLHHQVVEGLRSRAGQGLHLGAALDLKDADGVRFTAERVYLWVLEVERVQVRPGSRVGLD